MNARQEAKQNQDREWQNYSKITTDNNKWNLVGIQSRKDEPIVNVASLATVDGEMLQQNDANLIVKFNRMCQLRQCSKWLAAESVVKSCFQNVGC